METMWNHIVAALAVVVMGVMLVVAVNKGVDGALLFSCIAAIAGIAGYNIQQNTKL